VTSCGALRISAGNDLSLLSFVLCFLIHSEVPCVAVKMLESEVFWSVSLLEAVLCF
ncbi:unnamed protein product, partial [Brassica oleracea var. botrytis]